MENLNPNKNNREERGLNNPKKDKWARRKMKGKIIGGVYIPADVLKKAQEIRIERVNRLRKMERANFLLKIYYWFRRLLWKIRHPIRRAKISKEEKEKIISSFRRTEHYNGRK